MTSEANPESPREIIGHALWRDANAEFEYDEKDPAWEDLADQLLAALAAAGYEITKLEQVEYVTVETVPPHREMTRRALEPLYRKV